MIGSPPLGRFGALLGLALALSLLLAGCAHPASRAGPPLGYGPGVDPTDKTISALVLVDQSGPDAGQQAPILAGQQAYFARLNAGGGLHGWQVRLLVANTGGSPAAARRLMIEYASRVALVAGAYATSVTAAIMPIARPAGLLVGTLTGDPSYQGGLGIAVNPPAGVTAANGLAYLAQSHPRGLAVALVYPVDPVGEATLAGFRQAVRSYHLTSAAQLSYPPGAANLQAVASALRAAGAGYVYVAGPARITALLAAAASRLDYRPGWLLDADSWSEHLITSTGTAAGRPTPIAAELSTARVVADAAPWGASAESGMAEFLRIAAEFSPTQVPDLGYLAGYCLADAERKIIARAVAGGQLTRAGLAAAKLNFGTVDFGGLMADAEFAPGSAAAVTDNDVFRVDPAEPALLSPLTPYFESAAAAALIGRSS